VVQEGWFLGCGTLFGVTPGRVVPEEWCVEDLRLRRDFISLFSGIAGENLKGE